MGQQDTPPSTTDMIEIFARNLNDTSLCKTDEDFDCHIYLIRNYLKRLEVEREDGSR